MLDKRKKISRNVENRVGRKNKFAGSSRKVKKQLAKRAETKTIKAEQETKEKLDRSANKLDRPTPKMPGMHQPSTLSRNKLVSILIYYDICERLPTTGNERKSLQDQTTHTDSRSESLGPRCYHVLCSRSWLSARLSVAT